MRFIVMFVTAVCVPFLINDNDNDNDDDNIVQQAFLNSNKLKKN